MGSFFMARFAHRLPEPAWVIIGNVGMGLAGLVYALATSIPLAIAMVMVSGLFNSPMSVARQTLLQRNIPRDMRGRVFSAYYVMRDLIFLAGMASAGLADFIDIRLMLVFSSLLLFASAALTLFAPGLGIATWRATSARLAAAVAAPPPEPLPARPATPADFDLLALRIGPLAQLSPEQRASFVGAATVRRIPAGTRIVEHGSSASSAYFVLEGSATAGVPAEVGYRGLSTMGAGDFFGEIAALTGSPRTADVVADTETTLLEVPEAALRAIMVVPELRKLLLSALATRLLRTGAADLPRLAGLDPEAVRDLRVARHDAGPDEQSGAP
jgi:MFS family permease